MFAEITCGGVDRDVDEVDAFELLLVVFDVPDDKEDESNVFWFADLPRLKNYFIFLLFKLKIIKNLYKKYIFIFIYLLVSKTKKYHS